MKILHTADWHLGAKTDDLNRLSEQKEALEQVINIAREKDVDMVLISGDIYDTLIPNVEAENLFFDTITRLNNNGKTAVVAISGNHDEPQRLSNSNVFTNKLGIYLLGELNEGKNIFVSKTSTNNIFATESGKGYLKFSLKNGEKCVLAYLPHPSEFRTSAVSEDNSTFENYVEEWLNSGVKKFSEDTINIAMAHLIANGMYLTKDEFEIYTTLTNNYCYTDLDLLQNTGAHYTALGHVHRCLTVDREKHIYYSGSLINNHFESGDALTKVIYAELSNKGIEKLEKIPLVVNMLQSYTVTSLLQAEIICRDNPEKLLRITIDNADKISISDIKKIKNTYKNLVTLSLISKEAKEKQNNLAKQNLTTSEIFDSFVKDKTGKLPSDELTELFLELMGEDLYEAN